MSISEIRAMMKRAITTDLLRRARLFSFKASGRDMNLKLTTLVEKTSYFFTKFYTLVLCLNLLDGIL